MKMIDGRSDYQVFGRNDWVNLKRLRKNNVSPKDMIDSGHIKKSHIDYGKKITMCQLKLNANEVLVLRECNQRAYR